MKDQFQEADRIQLHEFLDLLLWYGVEISMALTI
jgi:hypothetical protein